MKINNSFPNYKIRNNRQITFLPRHSSNENREGEKFLLYSPVSHYNMQAVKVAFMGKNFRKENSKHNENHYIGCMVGTAIGDAFGAPIEFLKLSKIKKLYGAEGLTYLTPSRTGKISFTDDTQLAIFTADGLLKSAVKNSNIAAEPNYSTVYNSYRNWYKVCTQNMKVDDGWVTDIDKMYGRQRYGSTCMEVLSQDNHGSIEEPINNSKGSGGVMRSAPIGLMYYKTPEKSFKIAAKCAALTHGNPNGYLSAGVYASIISYLINGETIQDSIDKSINLLSREVNGDELYALLNKAKKLVGEDIEPTKAVKQLGLGWDGDEALAIAVYSVLKTPNDFQQVLVNACNHDGDSDTVGSIAGGIMGTYLGYDGIPNEFKEKVELENELKDLACDLLANPKEIKQRKRRYPIQKKV